MRRRTFLSASAAALAAPHLARSQSNRLLKFIPQSDVAVLDPIWTTAYITRNHGQLIFDTLFATDGAFKASPQMAAGMTSDEDGKLVRIMLRAGLKFHDGTPVLAPRLCCQYRALVETRHLWGNPDGRHRRTHGGRRQDHPVPPETPISIVTGRLGKIVIQYPCHHAGAAGKN